jgi:hypothetical protein
MKRRTRRKKYVLHHCKATSYKKKYLTRRRKGGTKFNWFRTEKEKEKELIKPQPLDRLSYGIDEDDAKITYIPKYLPIINDESSENYKILKEIIERFSIKKNPSSHCEKDIKLDLKFHLQKRSFQKTNLRAKIFPINKKKIVISNHGRYEDYYEAKRYDDVYLNRFKNADEKVWCEYDFPEEENKWKVTSRIDKFVVYPGNFFNSYNYIVDAERDLINTMTYSFDGNPIFEIICTRKIVDGEYDFYEIKFEIKLSNSQ